MAETDEGIHNRWSTKQLLMDDTKGLPIPDDVQNNFWWTRQLKEFTPDDVRNKWWWMRPMNDYPYQMIYKITADGWQMKESMPVDVRNSCWWMRLKKDYPYQLMNKTTADGLKRWWNLCHMMYETTVDGWDQWRSTHTRLCIKQLLMDETDEVIHARWCTKQLLLNETNEGLPIQDDVQNNCWWTREMESIPDDVQNCWWMSEM